MESALDPAQLAVGEVEEVPRPTRWIEYHVVHQVGLCTLRLAMAGQILDPLRPRRHDRREDDLLKLRVVGVMRAKLPLLVMSERSLKQRAEDLRLNLSPVERGSFTQQFKLISEQVQAGRILEQASVCLRTTCVLAVLGPFSRRVV